MRGIVILVPTILLVPVANAADPPKATVEVRWNGKTVTESGGRATTLQGVALATLGTGQIEIEVKEERWKASLEGNHILVRFPKPQTVTLTVTSGNDRGDKTYEVSEFLVPIAVSSGSPIARVGDKYFMFGKWDPQIILSLKDRIGIRE
jgi:hypothetical protein